MSASLIGHLGSSAFRLSTTTMSMSLTGSCFSSESAPRPFHHGGARPMSPERAHVDGRDYGAPGHQSSFALTNSARTALVAGTVSIALSAAPSSQLMASTCNERNSIHSIELRVVKN